MRRGHVLAAALVGVAGVGTGAAVVASIGSSGGDAAARDLVRPAPLAAGAATVFDDTRDAFGLPAPNLAPAHRAAFFVGNSYFNESWVAAPGSVETRDGLGPLFNARSCSGCHFKDGRSRPPEPGAPMTMMLLRVSIPGRGPHRAPRPDPRYGDQIQGLALPGLRKEADVLVEYEERPGRFPDGEPYTLRRPRYRLRDLGYGPTSPRLMMSPRVAPVIIGMGLLEAVPEATLREHEDPDDRDGDGVSGRLNRVWDQTKRAPAVGRFGWKAEQPTVAQQSAAAFLGDMGITTALFPGESHMARQAGSLSVPSGGHPEVTDEILASVTLYARTLGVPARRRVDAPEIRRGERLFAEARCTTCHLPALETGDAAALPELARQPIHPYTDLLLHDMGAELADGRPTFEASGREWRTPPLWGIGLVPKVNRHDFLLHDGRARGLTEAVLWHDGEAARAREAFVRMSRADRGAVIAFLESL